ncbi:MAG: MTH938/NDUFAF3 family protein [Steroidobacteraceae bacterium]|nr:hypothetical protein [Nevskiaceae bacterium]MCP5339679.1 hypothetical protein [Nevskiaceae bacterium]
MKLTMENPGATHLVRSYDDGEIRVGEQRIDTPCLIAPRRLLTGLRPRVPADLQLEDLGPVFELVPEMVIVGWGGGQTFLPLRQRAWFLERRIAIEVMELGAACRTYNVLAQDGREIVALLFPSRD